MCRAIRAKGVSEWVETVKGRSGFRRFWVGVGVGGGWVDKKVRRRWAAPYDQRFWVGVCKS